MTQVQPKPAMACKCHRIRTTYHGCKHLHGGKPVVEEVSRHQVGHGEGCPTARVTEQVSKGNCQEHGTDGRGPAGS